MAIYVWLKFAHILGAMIWIGGGVMLSLIGLRARNSDDPHAVQEFARTLSYVGLRALTPAVLTVLVFGIWLTISSSAWNFSSCGFYSRSGHSQSLSWWTLYTLAM